jgi:pyridoxine 4-dehydrogenase
MTAPSAKSITQSGTFQLGELPVYRLGYGAMRLTGAGIWGPPKDRASCVRVLRRASELGINFIDTADSYGPNVSEEIIREALHPYANDLVIATKAGLARTGPGVWVPLGRPEYLRQQCATSSRRLGVERIDLFQLHRIDPKVPAAEQFGVLKDLVAEGKVKHVGLSEVSVAEIEAARAIVAISSVQNRFNLTDRASEAVLDYCTQHNIAFIPWFPIAAGELTKPGGLLDKLAKETGATPSQLALAWLLKRSPVILPIPGTSSVEHLEENCSAASVQLSDAQFEQLSKAVT